MKLSDIRIKPRILAGFAAPLVLMLGVGAVALTGLTSISERTAWVNHTYSVLGDADAILTAAVDMETGMRGYMLAGDEVFLEPYSAASERIGDLTTELQQTVSDNPPQVERVREAAAILEEWRTAVTVPMIEMRREIGDADTMNDLAALVAEERGKTFFDRFRAQLAQFVNAERALLVEREATFENLLNAQFVEAAAAREAIDWVNHTYQAIIDAEAIKEAALNMETGMRGFLLAGRENFLEPYEAGAAAFDSGIVALQQKVSDNPAQVALLGEVAGTITAWREQVVQPMIALRREIGDAPTMDDVADLVGEARGKEYFDAFRAEMAAFTAEEAALLTVRSEQNATTHANTVALIIGGVLVAILLSGGLAWLIGESVAGPVTRITQSMSSLAGGDKTTVIPGVERKDEVGEMAAAVGVFKESMVRADDLAAREAQETKARQARSAEIETLTTDFDRTVTHMLGAVTGAASDMEATAKSMAGVAQSTSARAADVAAASEQASTNVQTVASATEELTSSIREIGRRIGQSSEIASRAVEEARQTDHQVKGLADSATRIGDVVKLISDIAEQTNLLALNATIEAARAGDAGKGFAVVASEVKSLATQTASATEDISRQIEAIQQETQSAVAAIQSIGRVISEIDEIATGVASAVEEQGAATDEIARNVQQAAAGSESVNRNIESVTSAASETGAAADQASKLAISLNAKADELKTEIDDFLSSVRAA